MSEDQEKELHKSGKKEEKKKEEEEEEEEEEKEKKEEASDSSLDEDLDEDEDEDEDEDDEDETTEQQLSRVQTQMANLIQYFQAYKAEMEQDKKNYEDKIAEQEERIKNDAQKLNEYKASFNKKVEFFKKQLLEISEENKKLHVMIEAETTAHALTQNQLKNQIDGTNKYTGRHQFRLAIDISMGEVCDVQLVPESDDAIGKLRSEKEVLLKLMPELRQENARLQCDLNREKEKSLKMEEQLKKYDGSNPSACLHDSLNVILNRYLLPDSIFELFFEDKTISQIVNDSKLEDVPFASIFDTLAEELISILKKSYSFWSCVKKTIPSFDMVLCGEGILLFREFAKEKCKNQDRIKKEIKKFINSDLSENDAPVIANTFEYLLLVSELDHYFELLPPQAAEDQSAPKKGLALFILIQTIHLYLNLKQLLLLEDIIKKMNKLKRQDLILIKIKLIVALNSLLKALILEIFLLRKEELIKFKKLRNYLKRKFR